MTMNDNDPLEDAGEARLMKPRTEVQYRAMGMTKQEIRRAMCEHDYGTMCESSPFGGCFRTCTKCGQKMGIPGGCTPRSTSAVKE